MSAWDVGFGGVRSEVAAAVKPQRHREGGRAAWCGSGWEGAWDKARVEKQAGVRSHTC